MTPRTEIEALHADDTVADLIAKAIETGYSRFPIVEGDLDETIGILCTSSRYSGCRGPNAPTPGWPIWPNPSP